MQAEHTSCCFRRSMRGIDLFRHLRLCFRASRLATCVQGGPRCGWLVVFRLGFDEGSIWTREILRVVTFCDVYEPQ